MLDRELARAILRNRARRVDLGHGQALRLAVHGGRRGVDDAPRLDCCGRAQHVQAAQHVDARVEVRLPNRPAHVRLRRRMEHHLRPEIAEDFTQRSQIADVELPEPGTRRNVVRRSRGQIVHHAHAVAVRQQALDDMGADESRSTRHQRPPPGAGQAVTIPNRGHVFQRPRVKSGNSTGWLPFATDHSESGVTTLRATAS